MKFQSFGISNFKAFGHSLQRMPLKPITLIFGPNSAGKSSLLQSFLWALNAAESGEFTKPSPESASGSVDLGGFQSLIHRSDCERRIEIEVCLEGENCSHGVRIIHQIGLPSRADLLKWEEAWITESAVTKDYLTLKKAAGDARREINRLFMYQEPSPEDVEAVLADDAALQAQIDRAIARGEEDDLDWFDGTLPTPERFREAAEKGSTSWAMLQNLLPRMKEIFQHLEHVRAKLDVERQALGLISIEVLYRDEVALKATRLPGNKVLACQILDTEIMEKLPAASDSWIEAWPRQLGNRMGKTMFRNYVIEVPQTAEFRDIPEDAVVKAFSLLRAAAEEFQRYENRLVYLGPLRHLPRRRELLGTRGEAPTHPSLVPWLRLRDEPYILRSVNRLLGQLNSQQSEFAVRLMASPSDVMEAVDGFGMLFGSKLSLENPQWFDAETTILSSPDHPDFAEMRNEDEVVALEKLGAKLLDDHSDKVVIDLGIRDKRHGVTVAIRDVGTGISQIAPVLVHAVAEQGKLIAIEQPEIHIHPALQAELGDVFIESALGENKNTFLLETHSEHLILRLLRRIRETTEGDISTWPETLRDACPNGIRPEDIAVLYVQPGDEGAIIEELRVNELGEFVDEWPNGFFEERIREVL